MKIIITLAALLLLPMASASALDGKTSLVESARWLKENEVDTTWMVNYTVHFDKCHSIVQVAGEGGGGGNRNNGASSRVFTQYLAEFSVCPKGSSCSSSCKKGGKYLVNLGDFAEAYVEGKYEANKAACETVKANCAYDDDSGEANCYAAAGLTCEEGQGNNNNNNNKNGNNNFKLNEYMQCKAMENKNNNNNNNNNNNGNDYNNYYTQYYIGPHCSSDGKSVTLGVFVDPGCTIAAKSGVYETMYGVALPYSTQSMIQSDCMSCDDGNYGVTDMCSQTYKQTQAKCETNLQNNAYYQDTSGCNFLYSVLPKLEKASAGAFSNRAGMPDVSSALAWIFAISTILLSVYSILLYRRLKRSKEANVESTYHAADDPMKTGQMA